MGSPGDPSLMVKAPESDVTIDKVDAVGGYALQFLWSDGHYTGIYTWEYLRQLAPAPAE
jgi:DUF971 family protein